MPPRGRAGRQTSGDGFTASAFTRTWQMADMTSWIRSVQVHRNAARPREKRLAHHRGRWGRSALATPTAGCWPAASDVLALRATCCTCEPFVSRAYLATLIDAFWVGLQPVRRRRPSAHCEAPSHPPSDIPCSRARAGPLRDAARHRPPEKNHSHVSRLDNVATWMGPDQLLSHAPLRRCARAPVALTAYGWPSFSKIASTPTAATRYARAVAAKQGPTEPQSELQICNQYILLTCVLRRVLSIITGY